MVPSPICLRLTAISLSQTETAHLPQGDLHNRPVTSVITQGLRVLYVRPTRCRLIFTLVWLSPWKSKLQASVACDVICSQDRSFLFFSFDFKCTDEYSLFPIDIPFLFKLTYCNKYIHFVMKLYNIFPNTIELWEEKAKSLGWDIIWISGAGPLLIHAPSGLRLYMPPSPIPAVLIFLPSLFLLFSSSPFPSFTQSSRSS